MLKFVWVILAVLAVGAGAVELRVRQNALKADMNRMESQRFAVRRTLGDQQLHLAGLLSQETARVVSEAASQPSDAPPHAATPRGRGR
jgi:hypothetical protein